MSLENKKSNSGLSNSKPPSHKPKSQKILSISKTALAILWEITEGTVKSFFPHPYSHLFCNHKKERSFYVALHRLEKRGLVTKQKLKESTIFRLTKNGEKEAFFHHLDAQLKMHRPKKHKWDGRWRIIFFDVPEKKRRHRDYLRQMLKTLNFKELQKSIWVTPYKIPDFLQELLWEERIKHFTRFITVKDMDYDKDLKKHFKLK